MKKFIDILREYSKQLGVPLRSTSDLSPLEIWLINKIIEERKFEKMLDDLRDGKL